MFLRSSFLLKGFVALILIIVFYYSTSLDRVETSLDRVDNALQPLGLSLPHTKFCAPIDTATLRDIAHTSKFASEITYWKRYIRTTPRLHSLPSYTTVNESLLPESAGLQISGASLDDEHKLKATCLPALNLPITKSPPSGETDLTPLIMGISSTIGRLRSNSVQHFQRFLTRPTTLDRKARASNNAGFVVHLHNCTEEELEEGHTLLKEAGIDAVVKHAELDESMPERYLSLIPSLLEQSRMDARNGKKRTWIVLMDDDTFFPRPDALMKTLEKKFPRANEEKLYVGGWREVIPDQSEEEGTQAQGGAGVFLSIPMVHSLLTEVHDIPDKLLSIEPNKIPANKLEAKKASYLDMCLEEFKTQKDGDVRLFWCIRDHTDIKAINVPGLHQMDIFGDLSGFYESGGPFLSTHHWKSWNWFFPNRQSAVGDVCGEDCVFQRWVFPNPLDISTNSRHSKTDELEKEDMWPMVLSNGFSISEYEPDTFRKLDLEKAENTFNEFFRPLEEMDYGIGNGKEMRERVAEGMKKQWALLEAKNSGENAAWRSQWYGLRNSQGDIEKIAELVWVGKA